MAKFLGSARRNDLEGGHWQLVADDGTEYVLEGAAIDAGPKAMAKWCDQHGRFPMDEFVELIAFTQTREYAKRVVGIYSRYRYLYGPKPYVLPLTVEPKYAAVGPDY